MIRSLVADLLIAALASATLARHGFASKANADFMFYAMIAFVDDGGMRPT